MYDAAETTSLTERSIDMDYSKCIWMLAGVIDYKLCDREYDCEHCLLDIALHDRARIDRQSSTARAG
jgi:hypothetical protein